MTNNSIKNAFARMWEHISNKLGNKADVDHTHNWNDLKDKPFGKTTTYGDTLTWDGDTSGLVSTVDINGYTYYKVSDAVPTLDDLIGGGTIVHIDGGDSDEMDLGDYESYDGTIMLPRGIFIVSEDNAILTEDFGGDAPYSIQFPKKGLYFVYYEEKNRTKSLTINGYTGFTKEKIKQEYLPSGAGGGSDIVTFAIDIDALTVDKTFDELYEALSSGKIVVGTDLYGCLYSCFDFYDGEMRFTALRLDIPLNRLIAFGFALKPDNTVEWMEAYYSLTPEE
jgi:hypothetical protein